MRASLQPRSRKLLALACALALGLVVAGCGGEDDTKPAAALDQGLSDASTCDASVLSGSYLYEIHGDQQFAEGFVPYLEVGLMVFDGKGGIERIGTDSTRKSEVTSAMTYTVDGSCVGEFKVGSGGSYRATVSPSGDEVSFFAAGSTNVGGALDGEARRVGSSSEISCDASTLTGTYQYRARGAYGGKVHIEHGFEVYDGSGKVTNAYRVAGQDKQERIRGTYEVTKDCRAVVTYENGQKLDQYIAPDGSEFFWVQTGGFAEAGLFGGHEHKVSTSTSNQITTGNAP